MNLYEKLEYVCEKIEENAYLVIGVSSSEEVSLENPLLLSETAYFILKQLDEGQRTTEDILIAMLGEYNVEREVASIDVQECLNLLEENHIIQSL